MTASAPHGGGATGRAASAQRPSLLSSPVREHASGAAHPSIMSAIEGRARERPRAASASGWTGAAWALGVAAAMTGAVAFWWAGGGSSVSKASAPPPTLHRPGSPTAAAMVASSPAAATPAPIETIEPPAEAIGMAAAPVGKIPAASETGRPERSFAAAEAAAGHPAAGTAPASAVPKVHRGAAPTARRHGGAAVRGGGAPSDDADVDVIAALLRHSDGPAGAPRANPARAGSDADMPSIASLIRRCRQLGGPQALRCRRRICAGSWGKAEACPITQAPDAGTGVARQR